MINHDLFKDSSTFEVACCNFYENSVVQTLLGSSFHPGGVELTRKLGEKLGFSSSDKILDLASGLGTSAIYIAEHFGSQVVGVDISKKNVEKAQETVKKKHLDNLVTFMVGNVANLSFETNAFDYVISECSFCLFDNKLEVGKEIHRILKPGAQVLITDIAIEKKLPFEVENMVFKVACIANALSMQQYSDYFNQSGFKIQSVTGHKEILLALVEDVKKKLFVLELASGLKKINVGSINVKEIKSYIEKAKKLINEDYASYMILVGKKEPI